MAGNAERTILPILAPTSPYQLTELIRSDGKIFLYKGLFNEKIPIALKRYQSADEKISTAYKRDLEFLSSPENRHPNFIRYFGYAKPKENAADFKYLIIQYYHFIFNLFKINQYIFIE